ncbi:hypothetical protein V8G54_034277 [Vigna mungo]|uniref:TGS domain-containing protein n=1 Tax=Vigna mungo TaxID=3915 RepID=A0AAQ3MRA2_VIGMU
MSLKDVKSQSKYLTYLCARVQEHGGEQIIPFSCAFERNLSDLPPDEAAKYCEENKIQSRQFRGRLREIFRKVKCWQIRRQTKAPQAAGTIHTDFERGFICAEVMKFEDLKELGSESAVKAAGKYKQEGKTYVVQDGDIIFFKFNVSGGGKK